MTLNSLMRADLHPQRHPPIPLAHGLDVFGQVGIIRCDLAQGGIYQIVIEDLEEIRARHVKAAR